MDNIELTIQQQSADRKTIDYTQFAQIVIEKWQVNIIRSKLVKSGQLLNSFVQHVTTEAGGNGAAISFTFLLYLRYLDMGVSRGIPISEVGYLARDRRAGLSVSNRKRYPVYSRTLFREAAALGRLLAEYYGTQLTQTIIDELNELNTYL